MNWAQHALKRRYVAFWLLSCLFVFQIYDCSHQVQTTTKIKVLSTRPLSNTLVQDYPSIYTLHRSDEKVVLVGIWGGSVDVGNHRIRWEMYDAKGERIFATDEIALEVRPHLLSSYTLQIDDHLRQRLSTGVNTVMLFVDDAMIDSQPIAYEQRSIVNRNVRGAVIFPLRFETASAIGESFAVKQKKVISETFSAALYSEVVRVIPRTIPHYVTEEKIGENFKKNCFDDEQCLENAGSLFSKVILIGGKIELSWYEGELETLTLYVHNPETGVEKTFQYSVLARRGNEQSIFIELLHGILYKKGFLAYLGEI